MPAPLWSKVLTSLSRNAYRVYRVQEIVRNELLYAYLPPSERNELTIEAYDTAQGYASASYNRERGFFSWEKELLDAPAFPKTGRIVLMAVGGGRELVALARRGYAITGFEPSPELRRAAETFAREFPGTQVHAGSFAELVDRARGNRGALAGVELTADLVWFGWGSFTHLTEPSEQLDVLSAARSLWPEAPLLLSFFLLGPDYLDPNAPSVRLRNGLRKLFQRLGGRVPPPGIDFQTHEGFSYSFERGEIEQLFERARYRPQVFREEPFPHALLVPV